MLPRIAIQRGNRCLRQYSLACASVISVARAVLEPVSLSTRVAQYGCVVPTERTGRTRVANCTIFSRYCRALRSLCGLNTSTASFGLFATDFSARARHTRGRPFRSRWLPEGRKTSVRRARRVRMPQTLRATWSRATRNTRDPRDPRPRGRSRGRTSPVRCDARWRR